MRISYAVRFQKQQVIYGCRLLCAEPLPVFPAEPEKDAECVCELPAPVVCPLVEPLLVI